MFISHDASWAQISMLDEVEARSRCSRQDRTYPSKMHCAAAPDALGVTVSVMFVRGSNVPSPTNCRSPAEVRFTGSRSMSVPGWSEHSSTSSSAIAL